MGCSRYLEHISFSKLTPADVLALAQAELSRATSLLGMTKLRWDLQGVPPKQPLFASVAEQMAATTAEQTRIRTFLADNKLATLPAWLGNYTVEPIPAVLAPFDYAGVGEEDDFNTGPGLAPGGNFVRYIPAPQGGLPYFLDIMARSPSPVIVHEGIPGHWLQFQLSRENDRPARRVFMDNVANEGLAFYFEEAMLTMGLFDGLVSPRTHQTIYDMMRLRAVRAIIDVGLSTAQISAEAAVALLCSELGMSTPEAEAEVDMALSAPVQHASYVIGKHEIFRFWHLIANRTTLLQFHDGLLANGNLPIPVQRHYAEPLDARFGEPYVMLQCSRLVLQHGYIVAGTLCSRAFRTTACVCWRFHRTVLLNFLACLGPHL